MATPGTSPGTSPGNVLLASSYHLSFHSFMSKKEACAISGAPVKDTGQKRKVTLGGEVAWEGEVTQEGEVKREEEVAWEGEETQEEEVAMDGEVAPEGAREADLLTFPHISVNLGANSNPPVVF